MSRKRRLRRLMFKRFLRQQVQDGKNNAQEVINDGELFELAFEGVMSGEATGVRGEVLDSIKEFFQFLLDNQEAIAKFINMLIGFFGEYDATEPGPPTGTAPKAAGVLAFIALMLLPLGLFAQCPTCPQSSWATSTGSWGSAPVVQSVSYGSVGSSYGSFGSRLGGRLFGGRGLLGRIADRFQARRANRLNRRAVRQSSYGCNGSRVSGSYTITYMADARCIQAPQSVDGLNIIQPTTAPAPIVWPTNQNCPGGICPTPTFPFSSRAEPVRAYRPEWIIRDGKSVYRHLVDGFPGEHAPISPSQLAGLSQSELYRIHDSLHNHGGF